MICGLLPAIYLHTRMRTGVMWRIAASSQQLGCSSLHAMRWLHACEGLARLSHVGHKHAVSWSELGAISLS